MIGITDEALPPQQLYDYVQQVLESPDADKLHHGVLQMLLNAKARALRSGAVSSSKDEEKLKDLSLSERVSNAVIEAARVIAAVLDARAFSYGNGLVDNAFLDKYALSLSDLNIGLLVKATYPCQPPSLNKNLLTESFKWARAPPLRD